MEIEVRNSSFEGTARWPKNCLLKADNHLEQIDCRPNVSRLSNDALPFLVYIDNLLLEGFENTLFVIVVLLPSVKTSTLMRPSIVVSASTESVFQTCRFLYQFD